MRKVDGITYEILIRRAFNCGRGGVSGAEADIYRRMETAYKLIGSGLSTKSEFDLELDYKGAAVKVSRYVEEALRKAIADLKYDTGKMDKKEELEKLYKQLSLTPSKEEIDEVIDKALDIFIELKFEAR